MKTGIHIGASRRTVNATSKAITKILKSGVEQKTMRVALATLNTVCQVNGTMVSHCHVSDCRDTAVEIVEDDG